MSTYTPIASQTLSSAAASVTFSSIPQGYTDLVLISSAGCTAGTLDLRMRLNGDTGSNYSQTIMYGTGSAAGSTRQSNQTKFSLGYYGAVTNVANERTATITQIMNYSNSTTYKTCLTRANSTIGLDALANLWRNTSAITSIEIFVDSSTFVADSTFSIYGIAVGNSSAKADGGSSVTTDGTYWYHTFKYSGAFIPRQAITANILVVAGGGAGGYFYGNGGGAGGLQQFTSQSLTTTSYPVIVGAGGNPPPGATWGGSGSNSVFGSLTASVGGGGGGGGNGVSRAGLPGGSGGAAGGTGGAASGGAGTSGQGYDGAGIPGSYNSAGGGGAGAPGGTGGTNLGGIGATSALINAMGAATGTGELSGGNYYYAGGGGGYASSNNGGLGGGGDGSGVSTGSPFTGGGGSEGSAGGSGVVIIRYAV